MLRCVSSSRSGALNQTASVHEGSSKGGIEKPDMGGASRCYALTKRKLRQPTRQPARQPATHRVRVGLWMSGLEFGSYARVTWFRKSVYIALYFKGGQKKNGGGFFFPSNPSNGTYIN